MLNVNMIKKAALKGIALRPTNITLFRPTFISNGMNGKRPGEPLEIFTANVFLDDMEAGTRNDNYTVDEAGDFKELTGKYFLAVTDAEIKVNDYFIYKDSKYIVLDPVELVSSVWKCSLKQVLM